MTTPGMIYDLILLDIQMPEMSGTEVVAAIRSSTDERIRHYL
jgi:CheY-like chemotaxis protein